MALRMRSPLPSLAGAAAWINGGEPGAAELAGRPVFVSFWSLSCYQCHETADAIAALREKFAPLGVAFVAVHQPRGPEELDVIKVRDDALGAMGLTQPCAIDNSHTLVDRFENAFVPSFYVFNRKHEMRHFQAGDKALERLDVALERVLAEGLDEQQELEATA
jgi:thiol-disulfide isomerase/thioredoxin